MWQTSFFKPTGIPCMWRCSCRFSATWPLWNTSFLEAEPECTVFSGSWRICDLPRQSIRQCQSLLRRNMTFVSVDGYRRRGLWSPTVGASSLSSVHWCISNWLGSASTEPHICEYLVLSREGSVYQRSRDESSISHFYCLPEEDHWWIESSDEQKCNGSGLLEETRETVSLIIHWLAWDIAWLEFHTVNISARYILWKNIILAYQLSCPDQALLTDWFLLPRVFEDICWEFGQL